MKIDKKAFLIVNMTDERPAVSNGNYGNLLVYSSEEQAQAYLGEWKEHNKLSKNYLDYIEIYLSTPKPNNK